VKVVSIDRKVNGTLTFLCENVKSGNSLFRSLVEALVGVNPEPV
jgi:hypothetical protein